MGRGEERERRREGKGTGREEGWCPHMTCLHDAPGEEALEEWRLGLKI